MQSKTTLLRRKSAARSTYAPTNSETAATQHAPQLDTTPENFMPLSLDQLDQGQILQLQRMIGNRAVRGLLGHRPIPRPAIQTSATAYSIDDSAALTVGVPVAQRTLDTAILVQRAMSKHQVMWKTTHLREGTFVRDSATEKGKKYYRVKDDEVLKLSEGDIINADPMHRGRKKADPKNQWTWIKGESGGQEGFVQEDKVAPIGGGVKGMKAVLKGFSPTSQQEQGATEGSKSDTFDPGGLVSIVGLSSTSTGSVSEGIQNQYLTTVKNGNVVENESMKGSELEKHNTNLGVATGFSDALAGIFGFAASIKTLTSTKADVFDKLIAGIGVMENISKVGSSVTGIQHGIRKSVGEDTNTDAMKTSEATSKIFGVVTDGLGAIKSLFDMIFKIVKQIKNAGKVSAGTQVKATFDTIKSALETAAGVVKVVKGIIDAAGGAISAGLANTVPALGIAIGAATLAIQGYNFGKSWIELSNVRKVTTLYKTHLEQSLSPKLAKHYVSDVKGKKVVDRKKMETRKAFLEKRLAGTLDDPTRERYQKELTAIKEYELAHEMKYIGKKRRTRAGLHIFTAMTSIAGDIATLSGVGAVAGAPLKIFSSGFEVGMVGFRKLKQFGRDKDWWGSGKKTTDAKRKKRLEHAKLMMQMAGSLPAMPDQNDKSYAPVTAQYARMETLLAATGVDLTELYRFNEKDDGPEQQFNLLVKAMAERE